jgi:hypothetical protein
MHLNCRRRNPPDIRKDRECQLATSAQPGFPAAGHRDPSPPGTRHHLVRASGGAFLGAPGRGLICVGACRRLFDPNHDRFSRRRPQGLPGRLLRIARIRGGVLGRDARLRPHQDRATLERSCNGRADVRANAHPEAEWDPDEASRPPTACGRPSPPGVEPVVGGAVSGDAADLPAARDARRTSRAARHRRRVARPSAPAFSRCLERVDAVAELYAS